jgi:hypothetical protein
MTSVQTNPMTFAVQPKSFAEFDPHGCEWATDLDHARDLAFDWSADEGGETMIVWRVGTKAPMRWLEVVA